MVNAIEAFDAKHMKPAEEIPDFRPGDTVDVNVKIKEGNNSRIQTFTGVVIARQGAGVRETFVVRKISFGALPVHRLDQAGPSRPRASCEAVLPARSARQGRSHRRASRQQGHQGLSRIAHRQNVNATRSPQGLRVVSYPQSL